MTLAEDIAKYVHSVYYDDLPDSAIHNAKRLIVDTIGCGIGALEADPVKIAIKAVPYVESGPTATILRSAKRASIDLTAFVNCTMARYFDYNDTYDGKEFSHPSDNIMAILAVADAYELKGTDALLGIILAYEIQARLADAAALWTKGWDQVTYGLISVSAAASRIMGLTVEETTQAINIALNSHITMRQIRAGELSMWKAAAFANSARNALFAVQLAKNGMTGPAPIFEGEMGFFRLVTGKFAFDTKKFGNKKNKFKIGQGLIKYYPAETRAQTAIWCALQLRNKISNLDAVKSILIGTNEAGYRILGKEKEKWDPKTKETADHSLPYIAAIALIDKKVDINSFVERRFRDKVTLDFMKKIKVAEKKEFTKMFNAGGTVNAADITITLNNGETLYEKQIYSKGHAKNPMTDVEINEKFRRLTRKYISPQQTDFALEMMWNLERSKDVGRLFKLLA